MILNVTGSIQGRGLHIFGELPWGNRKRRAPPENGLRRKKAPIERKPAASQAIYIHPNVRFGTHLRIYVSLLMWFRTDGMECTQEPPVIAHLGRSSSFGKSSSAAGDKSQSMSTLQCAPSQLPSGGAYRLFESRGSSVIILSHPTYVKVGSEAAGYGRPTPTHQWAFFIACP